MRIITREACGREQWDRLVRTSPDAWVWALWDWQDIILAVPRWSLAEASFGVIDRERLVAAVPLQWSGDRTRLSGSGFGLTAPAFAEGLTADERARYAAFAFDHVRAVAAAGGAQRIDFALSPVSRLALADANQVNPFVAHGFTCESSAARVLDLQPDEAMILRQFSRDTRQQIKRAVAAGITVRRASWPESVDAYYRLHTETYLRTGVTPHPREYFDGIASRISAAGASVLWGAYSASGEPIAFHNTARFGLGAMYHTGCSTEAALKTGANYLVFWAAIKDAKADGCLAYEIGEVFPGEVTGKKAGLTTFKSKFGGDTRPVFRASATLPPPTSQPATAPSVTAPPDARERDIRSAYEEGTVYDTARICWKLNSLGTDFVDRLLQLRFNLVGKYYMGGRLVDLCCASGVHLTDFAANVDCAVGIDFSGRYLAAAAVLAAEKNLRNVRFVQADARRLPLATGSVNFLYSFSSLYAIPKAAEAIEDIGRVLAPGGHAILDLGNRRSLNAICVRYYTDWPPIHPLSLAEIRRSLDRASLRVVEHRRFQFLPLWADRPSWLWPLLHPAWKRLLQRQVGGRMLDEWMSSLPILRAFAFRHLIVCQKVERPR